MENHEKIAHKKQKNKHKRKHEQAEAEPEIIATESKKEKKKKNKQKQDEVLNNGLSSDFDEKAENFDGSVEESKKKKQKQRHEELLNNGVFSNFEEKADIVNGSVEESKKKKKNKNKREEEGVEGEKDSLGNGFVENKKNGVVDENVVEVSESNNGVVVSGKDVNDKKYKALKSFGDSGLPDNVLECCKNFDKPSPIQSHSWPFLLDGRDFIGIAATGSGSCWISVVFFVFLMC